MREKSYRALVAFFQQLDFWFMLPLLANLPVWLGQSLAVFRGVANALFDLDWRSMALRQRYVRSATFKTMRMLMPQASMTTLCRRTILRFVHASREEWEACRIAAHRIDQVIACGALNNCTPLLKAQQDGRGIILLTSHFDSYITGIVLLGAHGLIVHAMTTRIVEDRRLSPAVRKFFANKFRSMEYYMNGGKIIYSENGAKHFYRALERGEAVVIAADLPGGGSKADVAVNFLGNEYVMAGGALRMAKKTGSLLGSFVCINHGPGMYEVTCSSLCKAGSGKACVQQAYSFLEKYMMAMPERWWAAEQLQAYRPTKNNAV